MSDRWRKRCGYWSRYRNLGHTPSVRRQLDPARYAHRSIHGSGTIRLEAAEGANDADIQHVKTIVRMLRQRSRQVGKVDFRGFQAGFARGPFTPTAHAENGNANQRNKRRCTKRKTAQAGFVRRNTHLIGLFRRGKVPHNPLFMSEAHRSNVRGSVYFETSRSLAGIYWGSDGLRSASQSSCAYVSNQNYAGRASRSSRERPPGSLFNQ